MKKSASAGDGGGSKKAVLFYDLAASVNVQPDIFSPGSTIATASSITMKKLEDEPQHQHKHKNRGKKMKKNRKKDS